jgi:hypothetical protein
LLLENLALSQQLAMLKKKQSTASAVLVRSALLYRAPKILSEVVRLTDHRQARERYALSPRGLPAILAVEVEVGQEDEPAADKTGGSRTDRAHGAGESRVGCPSNSRRTAEIGNPDLGTDGVPVSAGNEARKGEASDMFDFPPQSPRGNHGDWFPYSPDHDFQDPLRVLCFPPQTQDDSALQRHFTPNAEWGVQQLREAFPFEHVPEYLIFDRDSIFSREVVETVKSLGMKPVRTSYRSPWQNDLAERWVGSCRHEMLDYVIVLNEKHLRRLISEYVAHCNEERTHDHLGKDSPTSRAVQIKPSPQAQIVSVPRFGGLHHRYEWREAV